MNTISKRRRLLEDDDDDDDHDEDEHIVVITGDLIVEILLRLPLLSVHRFQRVCKQWYSLIFNPYFLLTSFSTNTDQLLVCKSESKFKIIHLPDQYDDKDFRIAHEILFPVNFSSYHIMDSCNGLLLLRCGVSNTIRKTYDDYYSDDKYYVCNPITNQYFKLPTLIPIIPNIQPQEVEEEEEQWSSRVIQPLRHASLVFDPSISLSYKVIGYLLWSSPMDRHWQIYIYSSETGSWRLLSTTIPDQWDTIQLSYFRSVLLNGVLYWSYWMLKGDNSACLDVEKGCVWFLSLPRKPQGFNGVRNCLYFGECGGRLRLIERFVDDSTSINYCNRLPRRFYVMELMNIKEPQLQQQQQQDGHNYTWTVKYVVDNTVYDRCPFVIHCYKTKNIQRECEEEEVLVLKLNDGSVVSPNLTSKKLKTERITIPKSMFSCRDSIDVFTYKRTLFPVS